MAIKEQEMARRYSIADARNQLPRLVHEVERGRPVELTRRGKAVAVLLSAPEYARLAPRSVFREALASFLDRWPAEGDGLGRDELRDLRADAPGRDFGW